MSKDARNAPLGYATMKSARGPIRISRHRSESIHAVHKVPAGSTPYVRAKNAQLVEKNPEKAIPLFWAAINAGDRVDSALKDMAIVMKQQNRAEEAIEAIKLVRERCSDHSQEALDNILLDLYKRCGRLDDQIALLKHKIYLIHKGVAFNGKPTKTARSQGKKFQVSIDQETTRLLGNLGWALMQKESYIEAEDAYRKALSLAPDNNKMCNLGICLMKQGRIAEAKEMLRQVKPASSHGPEGVDSHLKAYERAQQMLQELASQKRSDRARKASGSHDGFANENLNPNIIRNQKVLQQKQRSKKQTRFRNSLNVDAPPFFASKVAKDPAVNEPYLLNNSQETLKRGRHAESGTPKPKIRRLSNEKDDDLCKVLPDDEAFEEAILAAILGPSNEEKGDGLSRHCMFPKKIEKRLEVFQNITLPFSPKA